MYYSRGTHNASSIVEKPENSTFLKFNFLGKYSDITLVYALFVGFITSAFFTYNILPLRILAVLMVLFFSITNVFVNIKNKNLDFIFQSILVVFVVFQLLLNQNRIYPADIAPFITIIIALSFYKYNDLIFDVLKVAIVTNFAVMIYEFFTGDYLIRSVEVNNYEYGRLQGIFSYSKEVGYFILMAFLYIRKYNAGFFIKSIVIASSLMSGSRMAMIFIAFIMILDFVFSLRMKFHAKAFFRVIVTFIASGFLFVIFI